MVAGGWRSPEATGLTDVATRPVCGLWCVIWRAEHGSIGGASVRLMPREPADASRAESTCFAAVPAGRAAAVFHRAGLCHLLRPGRRAGGAGPPPYRGRHAPRRRLAAPVAARPGALFLRPRPLGARPARPGH